MTTRVQRPGGRGSRGGPPGGSPWIPWLALSAAGCTGARGADATDPTVPDAVSSDADTDTDTGTAPSATGSTGGTGDTGDTAVDPCAVPAVQLGNGADAHLPLADGDEVIVVHGPQGGWHVEVSGLVTGTGATVGVLPALTRLSDGLKLAGYQQGAALALVPAETGACGGTFWGVRAYVDDALPADDPDAFICALAGERAILSALVTDLTTWMTAHAEVEVVLRSDPYEGCP